MRYGVLRKRRRTTEKRAWFIQTPTYFKRRHIWTFSGLLSFFLFYLFFHHYFPCIKYVLTIMQSTRRFNKRQPISVTALPVKVETTASLGIKAPVQGSPYQSHQVPGQAEHASALHDHTHGAEPYPQVKQ
jgi:hypothetical protein